MGKQEQYHWVAGLDIGTSKIAMVIGKWSAITPLDVVGYGMMPARGLKKGAIVNIEATVQTIQRVVEMAESMANVRISEVSTNITGPHIHSLNSHGVVAVADQEVSASDVERVIDAARAVALPSDQKILHILAQQFMVDGQEDIRDPLGMTGVRLEARIHMVTGSVSVAQNIVKSVRRVGLDVNELILGVLATSEWVLTEEEKELGVCVVDIGAGTTELAVFVHGVLRHTAVLPIGGDHLSNDIAVALRIPVQQAELIKQKYGCARRAEVQDEVVEWPGAGEKYRKCSRSLLADVLESRYEELFSLVHEELRRQGLDEILGAGAVLTGGSVKMPGTQTLAEQLLGLPVRLGTGPVDMDIAEELHDPSYTAALALMMHARARYHEKQEGERQVLSAPSSLWLKMKRFFTGS